jgi:mitochondrial import inner membrane translocase subunit TIM22
MANLPLKVPIYPPGKEPLPPGFTEDDRAVLNEQAKYQRWMTAGMESCLAKTVLAGGAGSFLRC